LETIYVQITAGYNLRCYLRRDIGGLNVAAELDDKTAALTGAFLNRFAIGFVIGAARLPVPAGANGLIFGVLLSLPDAIITKAYAPILILGAVGGVVIGSKCGVSGGMIMEVGILAKKWFV
jgi:hypothetical protein